MGGRRHGSLNKLIGRTSLWNEHAGLGVSLQGNEMVVDRRANRSYEKTYNANKSLAEKLFKISKHTSFGRLRNLLNARALDDNSLSFFLIFVFVCPITFV